WTTSEVPRKNSTNTRATPRITVYFTTCAMPKTNEITSASSAPRTIISSVTRTPSRICGDRSSTRARFGPSSWKKPITPSIGTSPLGSRTSRHGPRGLVPGHRHRWSGGSLEGGQITGAEDLGGHVLGGQLLLAEAVVADDREVALGIGDDLGELLVVGVQQGGVLLAEHGAAGADLLDPVDLGDEALGHLDAVDGVVGQPVQRDGGQREGRGVARLERVHAVLRAAHLDAVQSQRLGVAGLDRAGH